jgi:hypothetical protein
MKPPDPPHWTLNWRFGAFRTIWVLSGPFGCLTKHGAKRAELVQKFVKQSRVEIFRNEYTWVHSGPFWLPYETRCKTGRTSAKVRATKSSQNFSEQTHPNDRIRP